MQKSHKLVHFCQYHSILKPTSYHNHNNCIQFSREILRFSNLSNHNLLFDIPAKYKVSNIPNALNSKRERNMRSKRNLLTEISLCLAYKQKETSFWTSKPK